MKTPNFYKYGTVILACVLLIGAIGFVSFKLFKPALSLNSGLSGKNKESARNALNAIGEMNSVATVGANFPQFTNALQSSRIKYDAAMRDYISENDDDEMVANQLENTFACYIDAKDAWNEFIQNGDEYGFLIPNRSSRMYSLSSKYGFQASNREFYKDEVMGNILSKCYAEFTTVKNKINQ